MHRGAVALAARCRCSLSAACRELRRGDKEKGRQGDGETRRRGDKEQGTPLSYAALKESPLEVPFALFVSFASFAVARLCEPEALVPSSVTSESSVVPLPIR